MPVCVCAQTQTETYRDIQRQTHTETYRDIQRHTETYRNIQRHLDTYRDIQTDTETYHQHKYHSGPAERDCDDPIGVPSKKNKGRDLVTKQKSITAR